MTLEQLLCNQFLTPTVKEIVDKNLEKMNEFCMDLALGKIEIV
jgi:hypothetical protein